jgi:hypothetical protein
MQQLLQLKTEEPQDEVLTDGLFGLDPLNKSFEQFTLRDLLSILFKSSFLLELKEETKSLDITLDEEEKKLILKLTKETKSKSLAKKGQVYTLRKKWKMASLTLVYNLQPYYETSNELQPIMPIEPVREVVKPLVVTQPKTMISDVPKLQIKPPILIDNLDDITMVLPLPEYTENLLQELPNKAYEKKFKPLANDDTYLEVETGLSTDNYLLAPEKIVRPEDLVQQYKPDLAIQTSTQDFEGQLRGVKIERYKKPIIEDGEFVYEKIRLRTKGWTTAYQAMLNRGLRIRSRYSSRFGGKYIVSVNGSSERDGTYWEIKVNGRYIPVTADKFIVPPNAEITLIRKTARNVVCGQPVAG